jgi:acetolactate synthase-1/2/3 large subunit
MGIGAFPSTNEKYLGMIGINGSRLANTALNNSDFILALGVSFSDRSTCKNKSFATNAKIVNVNIKKSQMNYELEVQADSSMFIHGLLARITEFSNYSTWNLDLKLLKEDNQGQNLSQNGLHSSYVIETLYELTKGLDPVVVTDVGQHQMLTAQFFNFNKPKKFITSGGLGTMGFGLPAAMGAQIAKPNSLVINITGDGSFQMNLQELATCREHNIPVKIIIMNNGYLGMVRQMQDKVYNNRYQVQMTNPDFTKIAEAYDLFAIHVSQKNELKSALEKAILYDGTAIVDIAIDEYEEI